MDGQEGKSLWCMDRIAWVGQRGAGQRALNMVFGSQVAISGKIVMMSTPRHRTKKKGITERATCRMLWPVSPCTTKRLKPTGGVICAISTTSTMKIPNQIRSIFADSTIGMITAVVSTTIGGRRRGL